jgi:hypothetical protein
MLKLRVGKWRGDKKAKGVESPRRRRWGCRGVRFAGKGEHATGIAIDLEVF